MAAMGAPPEVIEAAEKRKREAQEQVCWVYEENWKSVLFFFDLKTQWCMGGMDGYTGLNYPGVESAMRLTEMPRRDRKALFADIQIMEFAALKVLNKKEK